ncbi:UNVERIFIED_CONTAM: hypothetical protein Sangu_2701300 [Sesamum angustifolium]|uniref:C2 domain-containing protein n=1 Tax=Sesamum angustifolium TaxID=2727405 RepID=A0AAW2IZ42_9LAMI
MRSFQSGGTTPVKRGILLFAIVVLVIYVSCPLKKMAPAKTFQLLEINIISAQDLEPVSKKMKTYATAWLHPNRKLSSCVDAEGNNSPTWNDKFVFKVEEEFLRRDTSAVMIEIYAKQWLRDTLVGTVRVLVGNLIPSTPPAPSATIILECGLSPFRTKCALVVLRTSNAESGLHVDSFPFYKTSKGHCGLYRYKS